ncbi:MAG: DUF4173 domain-containing protein [Clostridiales bacterium]|jgi:hypothetical protein|nr:DUF4173 domain-containing protein [Clostridiales bacterium]
MIDICSNECVSTGNTEQQAKEHGNKKWEHPAVPAFSLKEPFEPDIKDGIFAIFVFILGFLFARWVLFYWQGWSVTFFTAGYLGATTIYFRKKGVIISGEGWFWLAVTAFTGISFSLWNNHGLEPWRSLLLFFCAIYWVICATGLPLLGKTSNFIGLDFLNGLLFIPLKNFDSHFRSLAFLGRKKQATVSQFFSIALGIAFAFIIGGMVLPLLIEADSGGFAKITNSIFKYVQGMRNEVTVLIFNMIIGIPAAAYIFGLVTGSVHKRGCFTFKKDDLEKGVSSLRLLPSATVYTLLGLVCGLYVVFVVSQLPYFFSAFIGERPEGWLVYSEYARKGFFELCTIAAINLSLLTAANLFSKKQRSVNPILKIFNVFLSLLTLLFISTAFSKMALYIGAYGLSVRRLLPSIFLVFLAVLYVGVIAMQKRQFSILRLAAVTGAVMLCLLFLLNPNGFVARYNAERYLSGTLSSFDVEILSHGGPAGVESALQVYNRSNDPLLREQLDVYLNNQQQWSARYAATPWDSLENLRARQKTAHHMQ